MTLADTIAETQLPVYGIVGSPLGFTLHSHYTRTGPYSHIILNFTCPRNPPYPFDESVRTFRIGTANHDVDQDVIEGLLQKQVQPVRNPFVWEGTLTLEDRPFCGTIRYYASPVKISEYTLKSETLFLSGYSYGPSCDEVIELLEGLQLLNGRPDVVRQYQQG